MKAPSRGSHAYSSLRTGDFDEEGNNPTITYAEKRIKEQDSSLESLGRSVSRLGELSLTISKEIDTQNKLLTNLEVDVERAKDSTDSIVNRTKDLVAKSGGSKVICVIIVLVVILIVLTYMVIFM